MIFPVLINGGLALLWGAAYAHGGPTHLLFLSGLMAGVAFMCLVIEVVDLR